MLRRHPLESLTNLTQESPHLHIALGSSKDVAGSARDTSELRVRGSGRLHHKDPERVANEAKGSRGVCCPGSRAGISGGKRLSMSNVAGQPSETRTESSPLSRQGTEMSDFNDDLLGGVVCSDA